ncbi:MAG: GAF domain-containing protein [Caldimonas sp.]
MAGVAEPGSALHAADVAALSAAIAAVDAPQAVLRAIDRIAAARMSVSIFSASRCFLDTLELERIYSSLPDAYPVATRKSKRQTEWARRVMLERQVFVGEGPLEMAAAFDDQERMASLGIRSIINVPVVIRDRCLGVLNFGRNVERVSLEEVVMGRFLGIAAGIAFVAEPAATGKPA